ncbi:HNH endonuclease signature motif containing protein [Methylobacterium komagatae]
MGNHQYPTVSLARDGFGHRRLVHRLVCEAFHGPAPTPEHQVAHADGTRWNARADNLRWATRTENTGRLRSSRHPRDWPPPWPHYRSRGRPARRTARPREAQRGRRDRHPIRDLAHGHVPRGRIRGLPRHRLPYPLEENLEAPVTDLSLHDRATIRPAEC